ncbi:MAG: hypothetical protein AAGI24_02200 [Pseudomonadota bacterium]
MSSSNSLIHQIPAAAEFRRQWAANPRLRWLLFGVVVVFLLYLILAADDTRLAALDDYERLALREAKLTALAESEDADFAGYLAQERDTQAKLRERMWLASSEGLAGAEFQSWLRRVAGIAEIEGLRLDLSDLRPVPGVTSPVWRLEAEFTGIATPENARRVIGLITSSQRVVVVERLSFSPPRGNRLNVQLAAHFLIER